MLGLSLDFEKDFDLIRCNGLTIKIEIMGIHGLMF